mmetsp:Transcript_49919/g.108134  ORF Transcript_49919/g.108134 Transcript_49919/m.108134 type:complete len:262 (-) Transcript_49919:1331-2116(-)
MYETTRSQVDLSFSSFRELNRFKHFFPKTTRRQPQLSAALVAGAAQGCCYLVRVLPLSLTIMKSASVGVARAASLALTLRAGLSAFSRVVWPRDRVTLFPRCSRSCVGRRDHRESVDWTLARWAIHSSLARASACSDAASMKIAGSAVLEAASAAPPVAAHTLSTALLTKLAASVAGLSAGPRKTWAAPDSFWMCFRWTPFAPMMWLLSLKSEGIRPRPAGSWKGTTSRSQWADTSALDCLRHALIIACMRVSCSVRPWAR